MNIHVGVAGFAGNRDYILPAYAEYCTAAGYAAHDY
jgi:hypothetical protein